MEKIKSLRWLQGKKGARGNRMAAGIKWRENPDLKVAGEVAATDR
jgi:hypothetical protein